MRIRNGPLLGVEGVFLRTKNDYRVIVSVELLRQAVAVEVDLADIERVSAANRILPVAAVSSRRFDVAPLAKVR